MSNAKASLYCNARLRNKKVNAKKNNSAVTENL